MSADSSLVSSYPVTPAAIPPPPTPGATAQDADTERAARRAVSLQQIVRPQVRDRWTGLTTRGLTPDRVMTILNSAFTGSLVGQFALFDLMEDTWPRLKKNLNELKRAVEMAGWHAEAFGLPGDKPSPRALQKQALLTQMMSTFAPDPTADENGWGPMIYDLCDAIGRGISVQEIYWEVRDNYLGSGGTAVVPRATKWIPSRYYGWYSLDPNLQLTPTGYGTDWQPFPPDKFIVSIFKTKTGHPLTAPLLRSLATFWIGSNFSYDWTLNLAQLFGLPFRWVEYDPARKDLLDDICAMLENMGSAGWGAFPAGTKLSLHEAVKQASQTPQAFLMEMADTAADLLILGQTLTSTQGKGGGSRALGQVHQDVRQDVLEYVAAWSADRLNESLTPALMRLNFGDNEEDARLVCEIVTEQDAKVLAERDQILIGGLGMPVPKKWLYDRHDIPMPEPGDDVYNAPAPPPPPPPGGGAMLPNGDGNDTQAKLRLPPGLVYAKDATDKLTDNVLENLTGVEERWLGGVRPFFAQLVGMAQSDQVTDAEFVQTLEAALEKGSTVFPELFAKLGTGDLMDAMSDAMGPALINGATKGILQRGKGSVS